MGHLFPFPPKNKSWILAASNPTSVKVARFLPLAPFPCLQNPTIFAPTRTVQEIEAAIPGLTRAEVEELRAWIEDYLVVKYLCMGGVDR